MARQRQNNTASRNASIRSGKDSKQAAYAVSSPRRIPYLMSCCMILAAMPAMLACQLLWNMSTKESSAKVTPTSVSASPPSGPSPTLAGAVKYQKQVESEAVKGNLTSLHRWLYSTLRLYDALVADGAPANIIEYPLSELGRITFHYMPWSKLLGDKGLLTQLAPRLIEWVGSNSFADSCCSRYECVAGQVDTALILQELGLAWNATNLLSQVQAQAIGNNEACYGVTWRLDRLVTPLGVHYPREYGWLIDAANAPAFWLAADVPMAAHLESHSEEIISELEPLCRSAAVSHYDSEDEGMFSIHRVSPDLAQELGSWTSLSLMHSGTWNEAACNTKTPRTCSLLRERPELTGALVSSSEQDTFLHNVFASVYRLRPGSHIYRHVGNAWRLNTHLGIVTPKGASIRVWNETRAWKAGGALSFLDAAEHEVFHEGTEDRCVLNVVSWHPAVMERLKTDAQFASHFVHTTEE